MAKERAGLAETVAVSKRHNREMSANERAKADAHTEEISKLTERIAELTEMDRRDAVMAETYRKYPALWQHESVTRNEGTYRPDGQHSFFRDLFAATTQGSSDARMRLDRNNREVAETRAISTVNGAGGEFVPPLYLENQWIHLARPGRAVANTFNQMPLPGGTDILNIPRINSGTAMAPQGTQNTAIQQTDLTTTLASSPVITLAGGQTLSLQLIEQSPIGTDEVVLADLAEEYGRQVGAQCLFGTGTAGNLLGILNLPGAQTVAYTSTTPALAGVGNLYGKIQQAVGLVSGSRFAPPTVIAMRPQRWAWASAQYDTANRPFILPTAAGPNSAMGIASDAQAQGVVGVISNIPVVLDPGIPANLGAGTDQDAILVYRATDINLYESQIRLQALPQTYAQNLSVFIRAYNYLALISRYQSSVAIITGTGMRQSLMAY